MKLVSGLLNKCILVLLLILATPIDIFADNTNDPSFKFLYLEDQNSQFHPDELKYKNFFHKLPPRGFSDSTWWVKIDLTQTDLKNTVILVEYPLLDHVEFYFQTKDSSEWNNIRTGDNVDFAKREVENKNFVFFLQEEMISPLFLRIKTDGPLIIPVKILSIHDYNKSLNRENYLWGIYFGIVFVFILYNLILFFSIRDTIYIFYLLHIIAFSTLQAVLNGIAFEFLWPTFPYFANVSPNIFHALSLFSVLLFSIKFLRLREYLPFAFKFISFMAVIYFCFIFAAFYAPFYKYLLITQTYLIIFSSIFVLSAAVFAIQKGYAPAKYYMAGWIAFFFAIIINRLKILGYIPQNFFTDYGVLFAFLLEVILFSVALGFRIIEIRRQKEESERERQKLISDLHDNLGGDLTDMVYYLNKFIDKDKVESSDLQTLRGASEKALNTLRTRIRSKEEILLLEENFIDGIRLHLITRYTNARRPLKTYTNDAIENFSEKEDFTLSLSSEIFLICKEVCTNDLKYGFGESIWNFILEKDVFTFRLSTQTNYMQENKGLGTGNLKKRAEKIGAQIEMNKMENKFEFIFEMKVSSSGYFNF